ncbi:MAG: DUF3795 domain-containing protein [Candidatus Bathyarchaeota archaeon]|nr:MAG: DUF3795 domain-containing protein [Candidatus Bathyarchaeota archaeon]
MKSNSSGKWVISTCGLNCAKCDIYEAGHGNERVRDQILAWFEKDRNQILKPEDVRCDGCRGSLEKHWSSDCMIMLCAKNKAVEYCFECTDFPCTLLKEFGSDGISHHARTVKNLKRMKAIGIDAWIEEQRSNGKCVFCP